MNSFGGIEEGFLQGFLWGVENRQNFEEFIKKMPPGIRIITTVAINALFGALAGAVVGLPLVGALLGAFGSVVHLITNEVKDVIFHKCKNNIILKILSLAIVVSAIAIVGFGVFSLSFFEFSIIFTLWALSSFLLSITLFLLYALGNGICKKLSK